MPDTILVVGRNAVKLKYLKSLLSFHEYEIIEYSNFYNTLKLLQLAHSNISLIVFHFDRNENKNAEHLIERIRQETRYTKIPIMVLGEFSYKENVHLRRIGIEGIFNHDLPDKVIVRKIGNFIKRKRHEIKFTSHAHLARQTPLEEDPVFQKNSISSEQLLTLIEILNLIHMARNLDVLMSFIFKEVNRLIPFHSISITLKNTFDDKLMLYFRDSQDSKVLNKKPITLSTTNGPGRVFSVPHTLLQSDTHANATIQFEFEEVLNFNDVLLSSIRSAVIVPLIADREVIGTLNLGHNEIGFYTEDKLRVLRAVTPHITIAIENARLAEEVRELSNQLEHAMEEKDAEIQKKYYHLSLLNNVGYAMQGAVDLEKVLYLILTCVTAGGAIGFNRAILFKVNYDTRMIKGVMGVGAASGDEARQIWANLSRTSWSLDDFLKECNYINLPKSNLDRIANTIEVSLDDSSDFIVMSVQEKRPFLITDAKKDPRVNRLIKEKLDVEEFVIVPLLAHDKVIGVIIADNLFSGNIIDENNVQLLSTFANQAGLAFERAEAHDNLAKKMEELGQAYVKLQETQDKLVRSERLATIGKMAAHVAHEIRNPLATIGGFAHAMCKYPHDKKKVETNAEIIRDEVYRLERILQNVLDFTKPTLPTLRRESLNKVVNDTIILLHKEIEENSIVLRSSFDENIPEILFDSQQIKQAMINILKNAVYSILERQDKTADAVIGISTSLSKKHVKLTVSDTGNGMTKDVLENIFNPFFTTRPGGSGLGLAVTHKIVEDHGGFIEVNSHVGFGSEIIVYLPLQQ